VIPSGKFDIWLVVEPTPLKNMKVSTGLLLPGKIQNVPNHQPDIDPENHPFLEVSLIFQPENCDRVEVLIYWRVMSTISGI